MPTSIRFSVKTDEQEEFKIVAATEDHRNISFARNLELFSHGDEVNSLLEDEKDESIKFNGSSLKAFHMVLEGLQPDSLYTWSATGDVHGRFRTPPRTGTKYNFTFAFASCADNDSDHAIFSLVPHNQNPLFMIHLGDLHYGNLKRNDFRVFAGMYDRTMLRPHQAYMFQNVPVVYMWDDHDFGPNSELETHVLQS
jgi:phosphodiesterase/alkaline phosphatase D-like protein